MRNRIKLAAQSIAWILIGAQGSLAEGDLGYAVSAINAEDFSTGNTANVMPLLNLSSGVHVIASTGSEGPGSRVTIRGYTDISGGTQQPLYVIDGVPISDSAYSFSNAKVPDPADIQSVEILKGTAASTLYGHRGLNGVVMITTSSGHKRSGLATEISSQLQNPAVDLNYDLSGVTYGASTSWNFDSGRVLPYQFAIGVKGYNLDGDANISDLTFTEGLGVTGIGGTPGVFVGFPTDILTGEIEVERSGFELSADLAMPLRISAYGASNRGGFQNLYGLGNGRPSVGIFSLYTGLRAGTLDQTETTRFQADTPAFGADSSWLADYRTEFEGQYAGALVGLGYSRTFTTAKDRSTTFNFTGSIGYDQHRINVREQVDASGLGGGLDYANAQNYDFTEGLVTSSLTASIDWKRDKLSYGGFVGMDCGRIPEINRHLPDSDLSGALAPEYSLSGATSQRIGAYIRFTY